MRASFFLTLMLVGGLMAGCGNSQPPAGSGASGGSLARADDRLEPGLQGQIPIANQNSGDSALGYRKGLKLVGQNTLMDRGGNFSMAWLDDCAYVTTASPEQLLGMSSPYSNSAFNPLNGMAVIDASNPRSPQLLRIVQSPAMLAPHEALHANAARRIIVATQTGFPTFEVYDATDCRNPVLRASINITDPTGLPPTGPVSPTNGYSGHAMCISDDGNFAVATSTAQLNALIDLRDLDNPRVLKTFMPAAHDCAFNPAGDRLYLALFGFVSLGAGLPNGPGAGQNGLMILDVSDFQTNENNPQTPMVGFLGWTNVSEGQAQTAGSHTVRWFQRNGHPYLFSSDEWPSAGNCPWAHGRILDIADETRPVKVADVRLAVQDTANCASSMLDSVNYSAHYVGFDNRDNATTLFTSNYGGGLRVLDIRDPAQPREFAYYHPVPNPDANNVASGPGFAGSAAWDGVANYVRYRPETGHVWLVGFTSGFQILEFTESAGPTAPRATGR